MPHPTWNSLYKPVVYCAKNVYARDLSAGTRPSWAVQHRRSKLSHFQTMGAMSLACLLLSFAACSSSPTGPQGNEALLVDTIIVVSPRPRLSAGSGMQLVAEVKDNSGAVHRNIPVDWSSSDPNVATVSESGWVAAYSTGRVTISASKGRGHGKKDIYVDPSEPDALKAFPEAEGWGATALRSCRSGGTEVLAVTNLADEGSGSLRAAVEASSNDRLSIIVFRVAGEIQVDSRIDISTRCLYIAGQTAPGEGIRIRPQPTSSAFFLKRQVSDVVIRHLSVQGGKVNINVASGTDIVLDHITTGWASDKALVISKYDEAWSNPISRVTLSRSLLHEMYATHPTALQISAEVRHDPPIEQVDVVHNLFASNSHRNPNIISKGVRVVNNLVYNWMQGAGQGSQRSVVDWVGNHFVPGPMTDSRYTYEVTYSCVSEYPGPGLPSYYVQGNIGPHNSDPLAGPDEQWDGPNRVVACYYTTGGSPGAPMSDTLGTFRRDQQLLESPVPISRISASDVPDDVLEDVGSNGVVSCAGGFLPRNGPVERRIISEVQRGAGVSRPPQSAADFGGFPDLDKGTACADSDEDGIPDEYERLSGLNPTDPADAQSDHNNNGYTAIEDFVNGISP